MAVPDIPTRFEKSSKSIRSLKSTKTSIKSGVTEYSEPLPPPFEETLPLVCQKYVCPYTVYVRKEYQQDEFYNQLKVPKTPVKYKKITVKTPDSPSQMLKLDDNTVTGTPSEESVDEEAIVITSYYDNVDNLLEIKLSKIHGAVPRSLIQIIGFISSSYDYLSKITITMCTIDSTIIYELSKLLYMKYITDICLDGSPTKEGNYYILLDHRDSGIKYLSLSRCQINDEMCKQIASRLYFSCPAEKTLQLLNLSSNHITDEGAKQLGDALRTNRRLRYLNLADNRICDDGARAILDALKDFRLTNEENMDRKRRHIEYFVTKSNMIEKYLEECKRRSSSEFSPSTRKSGKGKKGSAISLKNKGTPKKDEKKEKLLSTAYYNTKAELFAKEIMGPLKDPFDSNNITFKEDHCCYSLGNMVLCYLNLAYNKLGYLSVKTLLAVLQYQKVARKPAQSGLIKLVIEGNPMPVNCIEYQNLNEVYRLGKAMQIFGGRFSATSQKKKPTISLVTSAANS